MSISHKTRLDYSHDVVEGVMDTRLGPFSDAHQRWERHELQLAPAGAIRTYTDGFGNSAALLTVVRPHKFVEVTTTGIVETLLADPFAPPSSPPRPLTSSEAFDYVRPSRLVEIPKGVRQRAEPCRPKAAEDTLEAVRALMEGIYRDFSYEKDVTTVSTTVAEVLETRTGVCQDFAHVLIALCRAIDIPARYVSGYIVSRPSSTQRQSQSQSQSGGGSQRQSQSQSQTTSEAPQGPTRGAGASHAWVEAYTPTHGWRGFDPTNNLLASESHVKMGIGRDYGDVPPTRGTFRGSAEEALVVEVMAHPID